ncbi:MAG: hypothetical protein U9N57_14340 [Pseudomonadota bacterium]|nr:hypothetical protein [Pseudomonadota bacterium]
MKTKKIITLPLTALVSALVLTGCGAESSEAMTSASTESTATTSSTASIGSFIDAAVEGLDYETTSGLTGMTNEHGQFKYQSGDEVKFRIGRLTLGSTEVADDGLVTPMNLTEGVSYSSSDLRQMTDDKQLQTQTSLMLRLLQSMDADSNPENGIQISDEIRSQLDQAETVNLQETPLSEEELIVYDETLGSTIDSDQDGQLDVSSEEAEGHFIESITSWENGYRSEEGNIENQGGALISYVTENHAEYFQPGTTNYPAPEFDEENYKVTWFIQSHTEEQAINMKRHIDFMASKTHKGETPRAWDKLFLMEAFFAQHHNYEVTVTINDSNTVEVHKDSDNACSFEATKAHANAVSGDFFARGDTHADYSYAAEDLLTQEICETYRDDIEAFIEQNHEEK